MRFNAATLMFFIFLNVTIRSFISAEPCSALSCLNMGECENSTTDNIETNYVCHCTKNFKGDRCQYQMEPGEDICLTNPCFSGGVCINKGQDFSCKCSIGLGGKNCKYLIAAPCFPNNPCLNNGKCDTVNYNGILESVCYCPIDFTGRFCETWIACSELKPCVNNGHCENNKCRCGKGYTGLRCEKFRAPNSEKKVVIINKGIYSVCMKLWYNVPTDEYGLEKVMQKGTIASGQNYAFFIPYKVDLNAPTPVWLTIDVIGGVHVMSQGIQMEEECYHLWGTSLDPRFSRINIDECYK